MLKNTVRKKGCFLNILANDLAKDLAPLSLKSANKTYSDDINSNLLLCCCSWHKLVFD